MKTKSLIVLAVLLLATAAASFATEIIITPSGVVQEGTVLHFSAVIEDWLGDCNVNPGQHGMLYISGDNWKIGGSRPGP